MPGLRGDGNHSVKTARYAGRDYAFSTFAGGRQFLSEQLRVMGEAYEAVCSNLHDSGQPAIVNEIIARRIIYLAKLEALDAKELSSRALASFGLQNTN